MKGVNYDYQRKIQNNRTEAGASRRAALHGDSKPGNHARIGNGAAATHWGSICWLERKGVAPAGAPFWRYLIIDMEAKLEIDVAVPVATAMTGDGRIIADVLPAGRYAVLVHTGPYDDLIEVTAVLLAWAEEKGLVWDKWSTGPRGEGWRARIETYFTDPTEEPDPAKWETELAFKLADDQPRI